jgi:hypothetical protein
MNRRRRFKKTTVSYASAEALIEEKIRKDKVYPLIDQIERLNAYERRVLHAYMTERVRGSRAYLPVGTLQVLGIRSGAVPIRPAPKRPSKADIE